MRTHGLHPKAPPADSTPRPRPRGGAVPSIDGAGYARPGPTDLLVTAGPYRVLRHPSYSGALLAILGLGLAFGNLASLLLLFGSVLVGVLHRIRVEEQVLSSALGENYTGYADHTSRLLPGVW